MTNIDTKGWASMETAPKTGEHILVKGGSFGVCGGKTQEWMDIVHYWDIKGEEGFYPSNGPDEPCRNLKEWMPLPDKNFISSLLSTDRTQLAERVRKMKMEWEKGFPEVNEFCLADGYNLALDEVLAIINEPPYQ